MTMRSWRTGILACASLLACGDDGGGGSTDAAVADATPLVDSAPAPDAMVSNATVLRILGATLQPVGNTEEAGRATLVRTDEGTKVTVHANGLAESSTYAVHIHDWPCAADDGGGHYKIDPTVGTNEEANEFWMSLNTGAGSSIHNAWRTSSHEVRRDALSIVVHDPGSAKLLCGDLTPADASGTVAATGAVTPFAAAEAGDMSIAGTASLTRNFDTGEVSWALSLTGLDIAAEYVAHVHTLPCDVNDAGGHYKHDPTIATAEEANELWLSGIVADGAGAAESSSSYTDPASMAREDAASMVVHRVAGADLVKVACADLPRESYPDLVTAGNFERFGGGPAINGQGTMTRTLAGDTVVALTMSDLTADTAYSARVHRLPCSLSEGGGPYKIDSSADDNIETNEIWLDFTTDGAGAATVTATKTDHVAHAHAQSIVVQDSGGDRVGCIDLD